MWFSFLFSNTVLRKGCLFSQNIKEQKFYSSFFLHNPKYSDTRNKRKGEGKRAGVRIDHPLDVGVTKTRITLVLVSPLEEKLVWRICNLPDSVLPPRGNRERRGREGKCACRLYYPDLYPAKTKAADKPINYNKVNVVAFLDPLTSCAINKKSPGKPPVEKVVWEIASPGGSLAGSGSTEPWLCCVTALLSSGKCFDVPGAVFFSKYNRTCHDNLL